MRTTPCVIALLLSALLSWSPVALARGDILPGKLGDYGRHYDVETEETFTARVVQLHEVCYSNSSRSCLALEVLATGEKQTSIVYLGPKGRLERAAFPVQEGAEVCVVASRVSIEGKTVLISKSIIEGFSEFVLRTEDGRHFNLDRRTGFEGEDAVCAIAGTRGI